MVKCDVEKAYRWLEQQLDLKLVTGAPGSGKSSSLQALVRLNTEFIAFDIDWLAEAASRLSNRNVYSDPSTWQAYSVLWFEVIRAIFRNKKKPSSLHQTALSISKNLGNRIGAKNSGGFYWIAMMKLAQNVLRVGIGAERKSKQRFQMQKSCEI